ncbi:hypothetical protein LZ023_35925 (plasmid) [Pseudomonas silvicola]|nr:hypothetical protein LZ023_35925 [Pseudomonas silvicola]
MSKSLGEAQSWQEQRVEQAITAMSEWQGRAVQYRPVAAVFQRQLARGSRGAPSSYSSKFPAKAPSALLIVSTAHEASLKSRANRRYGVPVVAICAILAWKCLSSSMAGAPSSNSISSNPRFVIVRCRA